MPTERQKERIGKMKDRIEALLLSTKREGMYELLSWMDENGFYAMPCSGGNHLAKEGGLAKHSLNVLGVMPRHRRFLRINRNRVPKRRRERSLPQQQ